MDTPGMRIFTVRVWAEQTAGGREYRSSARDLATGAVGHFRRWVDLTTFLVARVEGRDDPDPFGAAGEAAGTP